MDVKGDLGAGAILGDDRRLPGRSFALVESKLRSPLARPGIVARRALVDRLLASS